MSVVAVGVYGGVNINTQWKELQTGVDVLVATPGRLYDLILNGAFKTKSIKKLVIDEMDEMLNLGFRTQIKKHTGSVTGKSGKIFYFLPPLQMKWKH